MSEGSGDVSLVDGQESTSSSVQDTKLSAAKASASPQADLGAPAPLMNGNVNGEDMGDLQQPPIAAPAKTAAANEVTMNGLINGDAGEDANITDGVDKQTLAKVATGEDGHGGPPHSEKHSVPMEEAEQKTDVCQSDVTNDVHVNGLPAAEGENRGCQEAGSAVISPPDLTNVCARGELTCAESHEDLFFDAEKDKDDELFFDAEAKDNMTLLPSDTGSADGALAEPAEQQQNQASDRQVNGPVDNNQQPPGDVSTGEPQPPECTQPATQPDLNSPPAIAAEATAASPATAADGTALPEAGPINTGNVTDDSQNPATEVGTETEAGHQVSQGEGAGIIAAAADPAPGDTPGEAQEESQNPASGLNAASIDLGKLGAISLSTQLPKMADTVGIPPVDSDSVFEDKPTLEEIKKREEDVFKVDDHMSIDNNERLPSIPPEITPDPMPGIVSEREFDDNFMEKAVGSGRRSSERRTISPSIGHVEIDLSAQLENIFAGEPKQSNPHLARISGTSWNKTKTPDSPSYLKKDNADSGVDNDDDFDTLDKEIEMLRERYQKTQDRIQKALRAGSEECDTPVKRSSASALTREHRLGSAPVGEDVKPDLGLLASRLANTRKHIDNPSKDTTTPYGYYGTRRMITDQADVLDKLRTASQSFEEMEVEIRSLKNDFIESSIRRNQFYDDYNDETEAEQERAMYGSSPQNPYLSYYQKPTQSSYEDEYDFKLPKTTRKPWSYTRSYTDTGDYTRSHRGDDQEFSSRSYRAEDGAYGLPYSKVDRPRPRDRPSSLDNPDVSTPDLTDAPSYKPGKATSEFLRQIYAGQYKKNKAYDIDEEDEGPSLGQYSTSPWSTTKEDYKNIGYVKPYVKKYGTDVGESGSVRTYGKDKSGRKYGTGIDDTDSSWKEGKASKSSWDEGSYSATLPRNIGRASKQRHADHSPSDPKRDGKTSKFNFSAYESSQDLPSKTGKSKWSSKWADSANETGAKPKYGLGLSDVSTESGARPKRSMGLSEGSTDRPTRASKFSSTKNEKPFTSRFLSKRRLEAREDSSSGSAGSHKDGDKPFTSRFLRKSTGDLTSLESSSDVGVADSKATAKSDPSLPNCDDTTTRTAEEVTKSE